MHIEIYHNPRCSKSREALAMLNDNGANVEIFEYLKTPPSTAQLKTLLMKLNLKPVDIIRKGERLYKEKYKGMNFTDSEWLKILHENPILIERPIVVRGNMAIIARPADEVLSLL